MNTNSVFKVIDGPSMDRILVSMDLFPDVKVPLEFKVIEVSDSTGAATMLEIREAIVDTVSRKIGSGTRFYLSGSLEVKTDGIYIPRRFEIKDYDPKKRKGDFSLKKFFESQA